MVIKFKYSGDVEIVCFVNASWAVHDDCHGRIGVVVMMAVPSLLDHASRI